MPRPIWGIVCPVDRDRTLPCDMVWDGEDGEVVESRTGGAFHEVACWFRLDYIPSGLEFSPILLSSVAIKRDDCQ